MAMRKQTVLSGAGLANDSTGDWFPVTAEEVLLSVFDSDSFAAAPIIEFDLSDDPDDVDPPVNIATLRDESGSVVQVGEARADIRLTFVPFRYRIRARVVGGDGNTSITCRMNN